MSLAVSQECLEFFTKALSRLSEGPKRYRAPDSVVQAFDAALEVVLSTPVSRHIARRSLAVIDDSGLLYPQGSVTSSIDTGVTDMTGTS